MTDLETALQKIEEAVKVVREDYDLDAAEIMRVVDEVRQEEEDKAA